MHKAPLPVYIFIFCSHNIITCSQYSRECPPFQDAPFPTSLEGLSLSASCHFVSSIAEPTNLNRWSLFYGTERNGTEQKGSVTLFRGTEPLTRSPCSNQTIQKELKWMYISCLDLTTGE